MPPSQWWVSLLAGCLACRKPQGVVLFLLQWFVTVREGGGGGGGGGV